MKNYVGIDMESISRFQNLWQKKPNLLIRIFYSSEVTQVKKVTRPAMKLAGIWCAKEAVLKAFAPILALEITEIEIIKNPKGYPEAIIHHSEISSINYHLSISISHTRELATATALLQVI